MRPLPIGIALVALVATGHAAESIDSGKVFVSDSGVELVLVTLKGQPKAILEVTGSGTELDGKAHLHDIFDVGTRLEYQAPFHGSRFSTFLALRSGSYELYVPNHRDAVRMKLSDDKTKALKPDAVVALSKKQLKDGTIARLEAFDRKGTIAYYDKELTGQVAGAEKLCGVKLPLAVDWNAISDETLRVSSIPSYCGAPLGELARLCASPEGKAWVAAKVKRVACKLGSGSDMALASAPDGTLQWSTGTQAMLQEEFVRKQLLGAPPGDGEPPWGTQATLGQKLALEKSSVCSDGKSHYVVIAPDEEHATRLYWGDGKSLVAVPPPGEHMEGNTFYDPRHVAPNANRDFRGYDMRVYSSVELDTAKQSCAVVCGERKVALKPLAAKDARPLLLAAKIGPSPQKWRPYVLFRDEKGVYYYVDRGFRPGEDKHFRLFRGVKGALKEQKMTNVVSDSEGEIFSTRTGRLKMIVDRKAPTVWVQAGKSTRLREVPVSENLPMIYSDLGVYAGERMGTPCDEL